MDISIGRIPLLCYGVNTPWPRPRFPAMLRGQITNPISSTHERTFMKPTKSQFLIALLSVSLPLALTGCNRSSSNTEANPAPPVVSVDSTAAPATATAPAPATTTASAPSTPAPDTIPGAATTPNVAPVPGDSSKANGNSPVDNTQSPNSPDQSSKTNVVSPDATQAPAAPNQSSKPNIP